MRKYPCLVIATQYDVRFAYGGKVAWVGKREGDSVARGETIAKLDTKIIQAELDRQLADYEKSRAELDLYTSKFGSDGSDTVKYTRTIRQADMNAAVKDVEITKFRMDQSTLVSPVAGIVTDIGGLIPGIMITPANNTVRILALESIRVTFTIRQEDLTGFASPMKVVATFPGSTKEYKGSTQTPYIGKDGSFQMTITPEATDGLLVGMKGEATIVEG